MIFQLMADEPEYRPRKYSGRGVKGNRNICLTCPQLQKCRKRIKTGKWLMCEIPDELDMMRAEAKTGRFKKGDIPWNKGLKGLRMSPGTEFKKGHASANKLPVGTVTIRTRKRDNHKIAWIKVAEPGVWKSRAHIVWEEHHGPVSKGLILHRIDGDSQNDDITNLAVLTRADHIKLHRPEFEEKRKRQNCIAQAARWEKYHELRAA